MVSVLTSKLVDLGFEPRSGQTKDYKIDICCFYAKHAALRRKSKDLLAQNQDNVSEWGDMSIHGCNISITKGKLLEDMIDCLHVISVYLWVQRYLVTYDNLILLI